MNNKFKIGDKVKLLIGSELEGKIASAAVEVETALGKASGVYLVEMPEYIEVNGISECRVFPIHHTLLVKID